jgi:hypothetical protein
MYQKWKTSSSPQLDVEELERQLKRELLRDLKPILEAQEIQFPDIAGVMSEEEHKRSFVSTAGGGRPHERFRYQCLDP